jgi:hypothetical protein
MYHLRKAIALPFFLSPLLVSLYSWRYAAAFCAGGSLVTSLFALNHSRKASRITPSSWKRPQSGARRSATHLQSADPVHRPRKRYLTQFHSIHFNAGGSVFPNVKGQDLWNCNLGASAIYAVSETFNLMLETVAGWNEDVDLARKVDRTITALISPGVRYAFNLPGDLQIVAGAAVPVGLTSDSPDWGLFFYLSFEHPFVRTSAREL